jgi:hypothetical protein
VTTVLTFAVTFAARGTDAGGRAMKAKRKTLRIACAVGAVAGTEGAR